MPTYLTLIFLVDFVPICVGYVSFDIMYFAALWIVVAFVIPQRSQNCDTVLCDVTCDVCTLDVDSSGVDSPLRSLFARKCGSCGHGWLVRAKARETRQDHHDDSREQVNEGASTSEKSPSRSRTPIRFQERAEIIGVDRAAPVDLRRDAKSRDESTGRTSPPPRVQLTPGPGKNKGAQTRSKGDGKGKSKGKGKGNKSRK